MDFNSYLHGVLVHFPVPVRGGIHRFGALLWWWRGGVFLLPPHTQAGEAVRDTVLYAARSFRPYLRVFYIVVLASFTSTTKTTMPRSTKMQKKMEKLREAKMEAKKQSEWVPAARLAAGHAASPSYPSPHYTAYKLCICVVHVCCTYI